MARPDEPRADVLLKYSSQNESRRAVLILGKTKLKFNLIKSVHTHILLTSADCGILTGYNYICIINYR